MNKLLTTILALFHATEEEAGHSPRSPSWWRPGRAGTRQAGGTSHVLTYYLEPGDIFLPLELNVSPPPIRRLSNPVLAA